MKRNRMAYRWVLAGVMLGPAVLLSADDAWSAGPDEPLPPFSRVETAVSQHFKGVPEYRPGGIICRSEVEPLFKQPAMGWLGSEGKEILGQVPQQSDPLVKQLRTRTPPK